MTCKVVTQICFLAYFPITGIHHANMWIFSHQNTCNFICVFFQSSVLDTQSPCSLFSLFFKEIWIRSEVVCTKEWHWWGEIAQVRGWLIKRKRWISQLNSGCQKERESRVPPRHASEAVRRLSCNVLDGRL